MSEHKPDRPSIEVLAFARQEGRLDGTWHVSELPRLSAGLFELDADTGASWQLAGHQQPVLGGEAAVWLHLQGRAEVVLQCQRCLQGVTTPLEIERRFRFVRTEAEAARLDEESEDDVLVLPQRLDVLELLEDEFILSLPIVPRHDVCPAPLRLIDAEDTQQADSAPHPFAALAFLRGGKPPEETK